MKLIFKNKILEFLGIILVASTLRMGITSIAPLLKFIELDINFTFFALNILTMLPTLMFSIFGFLTIRLIFFLNLEILIILSMIITIFGHVIRSFSTNAFVFILSSMLIFIGLGIGNTLLPPLVKKYFSKDLDKVTAFYITMLSLGTALAPQFSVPLALKTNWRFSSGSWCIFSLIALIPWILSIRKVKIKKIKIKKVLNISTLKYFNLFRSRLSLSIAITFGCSALNTYSFFAWLPKLLIDSGLSIQVSGSMLALYAFLGLPISLIVPMLSVRMKNPFHIVLLFLICFLVGYFGLIFSPSYLTWIWISFSGIGTGIFPLSLTLINLKSKTYFEATMLSSFSQGIGYALAGLGPLIFKILYDVFSSWIPSLLFLIFTLFPLTLAAYYSCKLKNI